MNRTYNSEYYRHRMQDPHFVEARRKSSLESYYRKKENNFEQAIIEIHDLVEKNGAKKALPQLMSRYKIVKKEV